MPNSQLANMCEQSEPIAIVGMALRLPGRVHSAEDLWEMLMSKKSGLIDIPKKRFNAEGFQSDTPMPGTMQTKHGYFLDDIDLTQFDASFFSFGHKEAERMDPAQRQLLEIAWECLENAGETDWRGKEIGCYVGSFGEDWLDENVMDPHMSGQYRAPGFMDFFLANRVSYEYNWGGPSMTVKTGCSASLVALHLAVEALRAGSCSAAMVMGCNLMTSPLMTVVYTEHGLLSKTGKCKTFDAASDGYGRGEAVNAVYVKRLSDAIRDGNPIRAVIRASATNHDGRKTGMLNPNTRAQEALIRKTYAKAGITDFSQTGFFECHGTGTPVGDPLEVGAVANVFGESGVLIGAIKPNVGHSEGAAGISSTIKAVLALEHSIIPPNIYFNTPNPRIPWKSARLAVPTEPLPWPKDRAERVSVNSFGVGGSNAHVILESYHGLEQTSPAVEPLKGPRLLVFSASNSKSLAARVQQHREYLETKASTNLDDLSYTLGCRRDHLACRGYAICNGPGNKFEQGALRTRPRQPRRNVFVFTGQGAQTPQMGRALVETHPVFRNTIRRLDAFLGTLHNSPPAWTIEGELLRPADASRIMKTEYSLPCTTAIQIALVDVLQYWGVRPDAVVGHSSGEIAGAYAAGAITAKAAISIAYYRGQAPPHATQVGGMAAIGLGADEARPLLVPGAVVACENSPHSCTISGDRAAVEEVVRSVAQHHAGVLARMLKVESAFHSHHMVPYGSTYEALIRPYLHDACTPSVPFFSAVTGDLVKDNELGPEYWHRSFVQPVLFSSAVERLLHCGDANNSNLLIEIGPHPALQGPLNQILRDVPKVHAVYLGTLHRDEEADAALLRTAGELFAQHAGIDLAHVLNPGRVLADLPAYPWLYDTYIHQPRNAAAYKNRKYPRHGLLGARVLEGNDIEPAWRNLLDMQHVSWLADHIVAGQIVYPGAAFIAMIGEAIRQVSGGIESYTMQNFHLTAPLVLDVDKVIELQTRLVPQNAETNHAKWYEFKILSNDGIAWTSHCTGMIRSGTTAVVPPVDGPLPRHLPTTIWYDTAKAVGLDYGTAFRGLDDITAGTLDSQAGATIFDFDDTTRYAAHPVVLDQCFQISLVARSRGLRRHCKRLCVPTSIEELAVWGAASDEMLTSAKARECDGGFTSETVVANSNGQPVIYMKGAGFSDFPSARHDEERKLASYLDWITDIDFVDAREQFAHLSMHELIALIGLKGPALRILELASGEDQVTRVALSAMEPRDGERLFSVYTYACMSGEAKERAEERLADVGAIEFVCPIPGSCGQEDETSAGAFDLIIVNPEVLAQTRSLAGHLSNIKRMLRPDGRFLLHGTSIAEPMLDVQDSLRKGGFSILVDTAPSGIILAEVASQTANVTQQVTLLVQDPDHITTRSIEKYFLAHGIKTDICSNPSSLGGMHGNIVISLLDLQGHSYIYTANKDSFEPLIRNLCAFQGSLLWLLPPTQRSCTDPRPSMILGLARTIRAEHGVDITTIDVDVCAASSDAGLNALLKIYRKVPARRRTIGSHHAEVEPDYEYAIDHDGAVKVPRMRWSSLLSEIVDCETAPKSSGAPSTFSAASPEFRPDVSYLLIGGLGGLGRAVSTWMVEKGARSLVYLSRSAGSEATKAFLGELESQGCAATVVAGSVSKREDVASAVQLAPMPVAGVMQMSMVLKDAPANQMTFPEWNVCVQPKVQGTWNLHDALISAPLDFFVLFSSINGVTGQHGQANYTAANAFLDAFVRYRHSRGLAASVIDIGVMSEIGVVAQDERLANQFRKAGYAMLGEQDLLDGLSIAIANSHAQPSSSLTKSQLVLGMWSDLPLSNPANRVIWKRDARMSIANCFSAAMPSGTEKSEDEDDETSELVELSRLHPEKMKEEDTVAKLATAIGRALFALLVRPLEDLSIVESLGSMGLDSLVAIELLSWVQQRFHVMLTTLEIRQCSSLVHLAQKLIERLLQLQQ
ncbi:hypothetical protein HBI55_203610 [Parastagonospora nodorum]|nr:hypothetical protein HBH47_179770 [Parastagonospora nodorum]KAH4558436.1 hypothetical protein HBH84_216210 [Parastagonospora nodorum]KAH6161336.1 hypothetical protein HBI61_233170 [Parastagonospora nodorum]KAH6485214.1 hypothetical protein HBI55_203610 [Parastagonospora nodorum]